MLVFDCRNLLEINCRKMLENTCCLHLAYDMYKKLLGIERIATISELNLMNIGVLGAAFCVIWIVRELGLIFIEKQIEKRKMY